MHAQRRKRTSCASAKLVAACAVAVYLYVLIKLHSHTPRHHYDGPQLGETGDGFDATGETDDDADAIHLVFSTDCGGYQHWQAISSWYASLAAGHRGPVTRIASGCSAEQAAKIRAEFARIDRTGRLRLHAAPSTAIGGYKYSNKPGGLVHFLQHAPVDAKFVALVDPDMLMIKPLTLDVGRGTRRPRGTKQTEYVVDGVPQSLSVFGDLPGHVAHGAPAGQHFGVGGAWQRAGPGARPAWAGFSKAAVCGAGAPCTRTTAKEADEKFAVGPVYIAHVDDWKFLAPAWWAAMPRVHEQYPHLLAEMYALTMSAANMTTPWSQLSSYMVSDPRTMSPTEAWAWIDDLATREGPGAVCAGATATTLPAATRDRSRVALPIFLHFCQRYELAGYFFAKRRLDHGFFGCQSEPLRFDADAIIGGLGGSPSTTAVRTAFMLCHIIPMMNSFLASYKRDAC